MTTPNTEQRNRRMKRILCLLGIHEWRRSMFVALNARTANLVCQRCHKQKEAA